MNQFNHMNQLYQSMLLQNQMNPNQPPNSGKNINQFNFNNLNFQQMMQNNQMRNNFINNNLNPQLFNMNMMNYQNFPYSQQMLNNMQLLNKQSYGNIDVKSKQSISDISTTSPSSKKYGYKDMMEYKIRVSKESDIKESFFFEKLNIELQNKKTEIQKSMAALRNLRKTGDCNTAKVTDKINVLSLSCMTVYDE